MGMKEWAENEVEIACKRENPDWDGKSFDYGCHCYQSALKAYKSLMEDGHSGMSFSITRNILDRLMNELPLSPITDDNWTEIASLDDAKTVYQNSRMPSLFKNVYKDGKIEFNDTNRVVIHDGAYTYNSGFFDRFINEMYPIELPYSPSINKYHVYVETFSAKGYPAEDDGYNTIAIDYIVQPDGETVTIKRYFADDEKGNRVEITTKEFDARLKNRKIKD